jgi:quercetin dioxygenase-like cupin family protein
VGTSVIERADGITAYSTDNIIDRRACFAVAPRGGTLGAAMSLDVKRLDVRRFDAGKMQKINLFDSARFFLDVYCLEPGQAQKAHRHEGADKVYAVLEGEVVARVGEETATLRAGDTVLAPAGLDHGVENPGPGRAALLVFMAPKP